MVTSRHDNSTLPVSIARAIVESSHDWVSVLRPNGSVSYLNRIGRRVAPADEHANASFRRWIDIWPLSERDAAHGALAVALAGGTGSFRGYCPTMDGQPRWWDVTVSLLTDSAGEPEALIAVARDITAERRVLDLEREARQTARGDQSASSHDILSALAVIKGEAQIMERRAEKQRSPLRETLLRSAGAINAAADRVRTLVSGRSAPPQRSWEAGHPTIGRGEPAPRERTPHRLT